MKTKNQAHAISLLAHIQQYLRQGKALPNRHREYMLDALDQIIHEGKSADQAFGLVRKGRPNSNPERDWFLAESVMDLMDEGYNLVHACEKAGSLEFNGTTSLNTKTVEKIYYELSPWIKIHRSAFSNSK